MLFAKQQYNTVEPSSIYANVSLYHRINTLLHVCNEDLTQNMPFRTIFRQRRHLGPSTSSASFSLQTNSTSSPAPLNLNHQPLPTASLVTFHPGNSHFCLLFVDSLRSHSQKFMRLFFAHFFFNLSI